MATSWLGFTQKDRYLMISYSFGFDCIFDRCSFDAAAAAVVPRWCRNLGQQDLFF